MHLLALILALGSAASAKDAPAPIIIISRVCPADQDSPECQQRRAEWQRVKDEIDVRNLMFEDLMNVKTGQVDFSLRARITAICKRLAKNEY
jgi:hypothetical protein